VSLLLQHLVVKFGAFYKSKRPSSYDEDDDYDVDDADEDDQKPLSQSVALICYSLLLSSNLEAVCC